jgi:hypothetical protein
MNHTTELETELTRTRRELSLMRGDAEARDSRLMLRIEQALKIIPHIVSDEGDVDLYFEDLNRECDDWLSNRKRKTPSWGDRRKSIEVEGYWLTREDVDAVEFEEIRRKGQSGYITLEHGLRIHEVGEHPFAPPHTQLQCSRPIPIAVLCAAMKMLSEPWDRS